MFSSQKKNPHKKMSRVSKILSAKRIPGQCFFRAEYSLLTPLPQIFRSVKKHCGRFSGYLWGEVACARTP